MSERIKTALFGGTFNPFHNGHLAIVKTVIESGAADELWLLITPCNPWKMKRNLLPNQLRLDMLSKAVCGLEKVTASDYEFNLPVPSYTADTLRHISSDYPDREFILIIGADNWERFDRWHESRYILDNYPVIIYPRTGSKVENLPPGVTLLDSPLIDISSAQIVELVQQGKPIEDLVPASVAKTVNELKLFR